MAIAVAEGWAEEEAEEIEFVVWTAFGKESERSQFVAVLGIESSRSLRFICLKVPSWDGWVGRGSFLGVQRQL